MKHIKIVLLILGALFLMACQGNPQTSLLTSQPEISTTNGISTEIETSSETYSQTTNQIVTTLEPTTETPTTEVPTTQVTTTEAPTTEVPSTEIPTTIEVTTPITTEITTTQDPTVVIDLYSINDFHGGAYTDISMISNIGAYLKSLNGHTMAISNGDIFQGTAISNYYHGRVLVDALNESGFSGFVIGNHEFDWGIDVIGDYRDGNLENGELDHPILAANIIYEDTLSPLPFTQPYTIEEFQGVKVGVIGLIGSVMDSIAASRTENIMFLDPVETAAFYATELREDHDVDIVVVYIHNGSSINEDLGALSGIERIDGVFNGHTHQNEADYIEKQGTHMPYAQMNNSTTSLVHIQFIYNTQFDVIAASYVNRIYTSSLDESDEVIDQIIESYANDTVYLNFIEEVLTQVESDYGRYDLSEWGASVIRDYANVDIGATNAGGFRVTMNAGPLTMGDMITIYPFDNIIKVSEMTGQQIQDFYVEIMNGGGDVVFDDGLSYNYDTQRLEINGSPIVLDQYYSVGAVDYIFDKVQYDFIEGINIYQTTYFMRDLLVMDLKNASAGFNPYNGTHIDN
jgi:2',3'-cyclic-nucleotide 2'-phosphodiesterase (5'-nucleotidase family)